MNVKNRARTKFKFFHVRTIPIRDSFVLLAKKRNDAWGCEVLAKLESCNDLVAEEALYHIFCANKFRRVDECSSKIGRPEAADKAIHFEETCKWLETGCETELLSIEEVYGKMCELSGDGGGVYSKKAFRCCSSATEIICILFKEPVATLSYFVSEICRTLSLET